MTHTWKSVTSFAMGLVFASSLVAATIGADAKQISFDPNTGIAVFEIRNFSNKNITAFNLSYDAVYSDGRVEHAERMVDYWPAMMSSIDNGDLSPGSGAIHPGATTQETLRGMPVLKGNALLSINATLDVVVYDDNTAEVTNQEAFNRVAAVRKARSKTIAQVSAILSKHSSSSEADPVTASEADLKTLLASSKNHPDDLEATKILAAIDDLHHIRKSEDRRDFLFRYANNLKKHVAQADLSTKIGVQQ